MSTAPSQLAFIEMSGTPRLVPVTDLTPFWYAGRAKNSDVPPPLANGTGARAEAKYLVAALSAVSFQATDVYMPRARFSRVPPTAVTSGSLSGHDVTRRV